jgi:hypothetical protein
MTDPSAATAQTSPSTRTPAIWSGEPPTVQSSHLVRLFGDFSGPPFTKVSARCQVEGMCRTDLAFGAGQTYAAFQVRDLLKELGIGSS